MRTLEERHDTALEILRRVAPDKRTLDSWFEDIEFGFSEWPDASTAYGTGLNRNSVNKMNWKKILKTDRQSTFDEFKRDYPSMEEMIRELWSNWFYSDMDSYEEHHFEQGSLYDENYDSEFARSFSKIRAELAKLDPINDSGKIEVLLQKLERHPSLPMETITYPTIGPLSELDENEVRAKYDEYR